MNREQFLAERLTGIGGSDVASLLGLEPYGCRRKLWYEKTGVSADFPFAGNNHTARGTALEPIVRGLVERQGRGILDAPTRRHPDAPYLLAHLDGQLIMTPELGDTTPGVFEAKCPSVREFCRIKRGGLPEAWQLQVQHYLLVTGWVWGLVAVFSAELWELLTVRLEADPVLQASIRREADAFWRQKENGPAPDRLPEVGKRCRECPWRTTCLGDALLAARDAEEEGREKGEPLPQDPALAGIAREYLEMKALQDDAEALADDAKARLIEALGDRQAVETDGARVYYRAAERTTMDTAGIRQAHPDIAKEFTRRSVVRSLRVYPR